MLRYGGMAYNPEIHVECVELVVKEGCLSLMEMIASPRILSVTPVVWPTGVCVCLCVCVCGRVCGAWVSLWVWCRCECDAASGGVLVMDGVGSKHSCPWFGTDEGSAIG